jgi:peptidoglycan hydrolase-like protein with peptidoglycan-binding domain
LCVQVIFLDQHMSMWWDPTRGATEEETMSISQRPQDVQQGPMVARLQAVLRQRGFNLAGDVNGRFGPASTNAVAGFQQQHGMFPTGVVDQRTWAALGFNGVVPHAVRID